MLKRLRRPEPFGKAGLTVAICALVLAMVGGAYAAGKLNGTQKKEVEKIAKKYAGQPGANGAAGANGTNGSPGANGKDGINGASGADGKSVTGEAIAAGGACGAGVTGVKYTLNGTPTNVCSGAKGANGAPGAPGPQGEPWVPNNTLPEGASETGVWSFNGLAKKTEGQAMRIPISFPIPLAEPIKEAGIHIFAGTTIPAGCSANVVEGRVTELKADPGNLCITGGLAGSALGGLSVEAFVAENFEAGEIFETGRTGTVLTSGETFPEGTFGNGFWAVTAPEEP